MILYGLSLTDILSEEKRLAEARAKEGKDPEIKFFEFGKNRFGDQYYRSDFIEKLWRKGNVICADVTWKTCAYVARYVTKKASGSDSFIYDLNNCEPEKAIMSRRPGIGKEYLDLHPDCLDMANIPLATSDGALKVQIPKYFLNQLENEKSPLYNPEKADTMKTMRREFASDKMLLKLQKSGLGYLDALEREEYTKKNSVKIFHRDLPQSE